MKTASSNSLSGGFYTVADAAHLIEVGNSRRIYGWLRGYSHRAAGPLIARDYQPVDQHEELSFLDLMEIRFVEHFREQGVRVGTLRRCIETARAVWQIDKPLASQRIRFIPTTDKKDILVDEVLRPAAEETHDPKLWSLVTAQYVIFKTIRRQLLVGVTFDTETHLVKSWRPRPRQFPKVIIDPAIAYGKPTTTSRVPTYIIYSAWRAGESIETLADWYDISVGDVEMAIEFENHIRTPKQAIAA